MSPHAIPADNEALMARLIAENAALQHEVHTLRPYKTFADRLEHGIVITDLGGKILAANPAFHQMLGYGDELFAINPRDLFIDSGSDLVEMERQLAASGRFHGPLKERRKDGSVFIGDCSSFLVPDEHGQTTQLISLIRDITREYENQQRVEMLNQVVEHAPDGIGVCDMNGTVRYANPALQEMVGYGEALIGMNTSAYATWNIADEAIVSSIQEEGVWHGQVEYRHQDGHLIPIVTSGFGIILSGQSEALFGMIARDMTEQRQTDAQLRLFEALVEHAPDGFAIASADGTLTYLNPAFRTMLGYASTPTNTPMAWLHPPHEQNRIPGMIEHARTHGVWQGEMAYQRSDGTTFDTFLSVFFIYGADGQPLAQVKIAHDITDQQRAEHERQALQEEIIQAQQAALRELSSPLLAISETTMVMPLIGSVDSGRAQDIMNTLLSGVAQQQAKIVIVDITGVPIVDTQVASALIHASQAITLLGAKTILTGIRPEVAQTLIGIGVDLRSIVTLGTLRDGIRYTLQLEQHTQR